MAVKRAIQLVSDKGIFNTYYIANDAPNDHPPNERPMPSLDQQL